jgi:hypothetical protein
LTEIQRAKQILEAEVGKIEIYRRLLVNPDFEIFKKELIYDKLEALLDLMVDCEEKDLPRIRGQVEALRGIVKVFEATLSRREAVQEKLGELK